VAAAAPTTTTTTLARSLASRSLACLLARSIAHSLGPTDGDGGGGGADDGDNDAACSLASRSLACLFACLIARSLTRSGRRTVTVAAATPTMATTTRARSLVMARPF